MNLCKNTATQYSTNIKQPANSCETITTLHWIQLHWYHLRSIKTFQRHSFQTLVHWVQFWLADWFTHFLCHVNVIHSLILHPQNFLENSVHVGVPQLKMCHIHLHEVKKQSRTTDRCKVKCGKFCRNCTIAPCGAAWL